MTGKDMALPDGPGSRPTDEAPVSAGSSPKASIPSAEAYADPYWEYEDGGCDNCGGEGFVYGCSWDWQCDTYDPGEGACLCTRPCDWCSPRKPDPELQRVLAEALRRDSDGSGGAGETPKSGSTQRATARAEGIAQTPPSEPRS